jgi:Zn-dependent protease with chaperone function
MVRVTVTRVTASTPAVETGRPRTKRLLRLSFLIGIPLVLLPLWLPRKVSARRLSTGAGASRTNAGLAARERQIQNVVDDLKSRMSIPETVVVSIVPANALVVSVERSSGQRDTFTLALDAAFLDTLSDDEVGAVLAHELGHVWIFTHHPFLHTEELANEIALRVVNRDVLAVVYEKVWKRIGTKGRLTYLPVE